MANVSKQHALLAFAVLPLQLFCFENDRRVRIALALETTLALAKFESKNILSAIICRTLLLLCKIFKASFEATINHMSFTFLKTRFVKALTRAQEPLKSILERSMLLDGKLLDKINGSRSTLPSLNTAEYQVFSQWGEDGIIAWLVDQLDGIPCSFVEFGVEDYQESNTRYLLQSRNWQGLVIDGFQKNINYIRNQEYYWRNDLTAICAFIDRNNINSLFLENGFKGEVGLLSIDIDGNDFWVWQAIEVVSPVIVVCEYNAVLGDKLSLSVPYKSDFQRTLEHYSNLYFGASIRAMIRLGLDKGYTFIGTTSSGCNAFFIRNDYASRIMSRLERVLMFPSKIREARDQAGVLKYTSSIERIKIINNLPFIDINSGKCALLFQHGFLHSNLWADCKPVELKKG
jgi:hypothetical protein